MARKKKNSRVRNKQEPSLSNLSPEELRNKGSLLLRQEKFQDAIRCFKEVLKNLASDEVLQMLGEAYRGRIENLAAKSMFKEALALLDTMAGRCGGNEGDNILRLLLQLKVGNYAQAAHLYGRCRHLVDKDRIQSLEALFGALLLVDAGLRAEDFPEESLIVKHFQMAKFALSTCLDDDAEKTQQKLKDIPFHSPYRDLRTLMTGLLHWQHDREKADDILQKISSSSPYYRYAARYLAGVDSPDAVLRALAEMSKDGQLNARELYGLNVAQVRALSDLAQAGMKPFMLYQTVKKHAACFPEKEKNRIIRHIVPFCSEHSMDIVLRNPGISEREKFRICALAAEKDGALPFAVEFWDDYLRACDSNSSAILKEIAMVLRYQTTLMERDVWQFEPEEILERKLKSLELDPDHVETWLSAAKFAERYLNMNQQYKIINDAVKQLPDNVDVLVVAMRAAGQRGAHKKAGNFAMQVLSIDPINTSALDFLTESCLEHARKLAFQGKWQLAEKELSDVDTRVKAVRLRGRRQICLGMLLLLQGREEGLEYIAAGKSENGSIVLSHVLTSLEARLYKLPLTWHKYFDKELRQVVLEGFEKMECLRLTGWLVGFTGHQWLQLKECCSTVLGKYFAKAAVSSWSRDEGILLCKAMDRTGLSAVLAKLGKNLLKSFPNDIEIRAYHLLGTIQKGKVSVSLNVLDSLDDVMHELAKKGKIELVKRLGIFLDDCDFLPDDGTEEEPFILPDHVREKENKDKKRKPFGGRQLNLFDDDI